MSSEQMRIYTEADVAEEPGVEMRRDVAMTLQEAAVTLGLGCNVTVGPAYIGDLLPGTDVGATRWYAKVKMDGTLNAQKAIYKTGLDRLCRSSDIQK